MASEKWMVLLLHGKVIPLRGFPAAHHGGWWEKNYVLKNKAIISKSQYVSI